MQGAQVDVRVAKQGVEHADHIELVPALRGVMFHQLGGEIPQKLVHGYVAIDVTGA